jgi:hypothetical protein
MHRIKPHQLEAPVSCHRTIELYLKAFLVSQGEKSAKGKVVWGHDLKRLSESCAQHKKDFADQEFNRRVDFFQRYFDFVRYPSEIDWSDGQGMIWFSIDSCILPLDELVAFIRPRIELTEDEWRKTDLKWLNTTTDKEKGFQQRALIDSNDHLDMILCSKTNASMVKFNPESTFDLPGC